ncbi:MAG: hypothetical protein Q8O79_08700 [Pseudomonadota bacterium]|nr:hypothetical protein [Pseudomonadota bacterium]
MTEFRQALPVEHLQFIDFHRVFIDVILGVILAANKYPQQEQKILCAH